MKDEDLNGLLNRLIADWESEVVEFKNVGDSYPTSDIGKYFSALSNEANLKNQERGWLVFGVDNRSRTVAGSTYGIHRMVEGQRQRFFPLPDYDLDQTDAVRMTLPGIILDAAYSRLLIQKAELPLEDVVALDRVQKRMPLDDKTAQRLKQAGLIEGRKPNFHVSAAIANAAEAKAAYIKARSLDDGYYRKLVSEYLEKFGHASRADIDDLLMDKLSDVLAPKQKVAKIGNLLTSMRKAGIISNTGSRGLPCWQLVGRAEKNEKE
jgi:ATP-dependent DNA helicase RecG